MPGAAQRLLLWKRFSLFTRRHWLQPINNWCTTRLFTTSKTNGKQGRTRAVLSSRPGSRKENDVWYSRSMASQTVCLWSNVGALLIQQHERQDYITPHLAGTLHSAYRITQQLLSPVFSRFLWPWEFGSGKVSLATKCITVVLPRGSFSAPNVTLPCRNRPWYISRRMFGLLTCSSSQSIGQLSYTCLAISAAESLGENRNSFVFPLTKIRRKLIMSGGTEALDILMARS